MSSRHDDARKVRKKAADIAHDRPFASEHPNNKEEEEYKDKDGHRNFIANFTKGLKHHDPGEKDAGEVVNEDYEELLEALKERKTRRF